MARKEGFKSLVCQKSRFSHSNDHAVVVEGIKSALRGHPELSVVGQAFGGHQAVNDVKRLRPDIVIMDISMPDLNGIPTIMQIKEFDTHVGIIVFTTYFDEEYIINMFKAGISGYILKEDSLSELILGIKAMARGELISAKPLSGCSKRM